MKRSALALRLTETAAAALALGLPLAFLLRSYDGLSLKSSLLQAGALALGAGWLLKGLARGRWEASESVMPLLRPAAALAAWICARWLASPSPSADLPDVLPQLLGLGVYAVCLLECGGAEAGTRFSRWLLAAAGAACAYALLQAAGVDPLSWKGAFGAASFSTLGSPQALGLFAAVCAPVALARWADPERDRWMRAGDALLFALLAAAAVAARSLEAAAAFAAACLVSAASLPAFVPSRAGRRTAAAAVVLAAAVLAAGLKNSDPAESRTRAALWSSAAQAIAVKPLTGRGPGRTALALDEARGPVAAVLGRNARPERVPGFLMQTLCELGAAGALLWLWLIGAVLTACWRARRAFAFGAPVGDAAALAGLFGALAALACAGHWSAAAHDPAAGWLLWPLAGLAGGWSALARRGRALVLPIGLTAEARARLSTAGAAACLALLALPARWQAADVALNRAVFAARAGDHETALTFARRADVLGAPHRLEARYFEARALMDADRPDEALVALAALERRAPAFIDLQHLKGRCYARLSNWELAAAALEKQLALDPTYVPSLELLAAAAKEMRDFPRARRLALAALSLEPDNSLARRTLAQSYLFEKEWQREQQRAKRAKPGRSKDG